MLNRREAAALLDWASGLNPGPWREHSLHAARAAEAIAARCGMDADRAWVLGALHDVGRYEGVRAMHHVVAGYQLLMEKGDPGAARICMTHSFPDGNPDSYLGEQDVTDEELTFIRNFIARCEMDEYDRLIQLCDALCTAEGVVLIEKRLVNVVVRHGARETLPEKWCATLAIRDEFQRRIGGSIYALFDDAVSNTFA